MVEPLKCYLLDYELISINAFQTRDVPDGLKKSELSRQTDVTILDVSDGIVKVGVNEKLFFKPAGPFKLDLELEGRFRLEEDISDPKEIENRIESALYPLFAEASLIVGSITKGMIGTPVLIAPFRWTEDKGKTDS